MAGFATRPSFAGHADSSAKADHELTFIPDHLMGAGQNAVNSATGTRADADFHLDCGRVPAGKGWRRGACSFGWQIPLVHACLK